MILLEQTSLSFLVCATYAQLYVQPPLYVSVSLYIVVMNADGTGCFQLTCVTVSSVLLTQQVAVGTQVPKLISR